MIYLYSGTPGSGKSLHVAERLYYRIKIYKYTICNFEIIPTSKKINIEKYHNSFRYVENSNLNPTELINFSKEVFQGKKPKESTILLVIDECQLLFNSRDWGKKDRSAWLEFFSQHRHYGYDIILVAQFDRMLDRQIRSLIEYEYVHRKINNYGLIGKIMGLFCGGSLFVCVKVWYPMKEKIGSEFFCMHKKYYSMYDTYNIFSTPN